MRLYAGPQEQDVIGALAPGFDLVVDYGIFTVLAAPLFWLLKWLHGLIGNWGWAIVVMTILIKLAFYPLNAAAARSMAKMKIVGPKLKALQEQYANDKQQLQIRMMELYKQEKINPLGGCLPILVQIPFFIALYWVLLSAVELRYAPWIGYIKDLSAPDPYFVLPVVYAVTAYLQVKLSPTPITDPMQARIMQIMPVAFSVLFIFFPSGLVLYWLVNNTLQIGAAMAREPDAGEGAGAGAREEALGAMVMGRTNRLAMLSLRRAGRHRRVPVAQRRRRSRISIHPSSSRRRTS